MPPVLSWSLLLLFLSCMIPWISAGEGPGTLWQIGTLDRSSAEFRPWIDPTSNARFNYSDPNQDFVYQIGKSSPARDWPAFQPGTANGGAGYRPHPCTIQFDLAEPRARAYDLELSLLAYSARLPKLQVEVNGRKGYFLQEPRLEYSGGDPGVFFLPHYSHVTLKASIPTEFLQSGTNSIVLTAVDDPNARDDTRPAGFAWPGSSGIHYDALALTATDQPDPNGPSVRVEPTIFYEGAYPTRERVDVTLVGFPLPSGSGTATLVLGGQLYVERFQTDAQFGEVLVPFLVSEFQGEQLAEVIVRADPQSWTFHTLVKPARKWTLYVVPNVHLDVGYTDSASKVSEIQSRILDRAIDWTERDPSFRFTPDGYWCIEEFWNGRQAEQRERLLRSMRDGRISLPAVYCSPFTGFASLENLIRLLYPSQRFAEQHGVPLGVALNTDVPNYSWSFASVLAASGVTAFVAASDAYRAPFLLYNRYHEKSPQLWEGPDGGRVLTWYSRHYHQLASLFGLSPQLENGRGSLPRYLQAYDRPSYTADAVILYGSQAENGDLHPAQTQLVEEWNARFAYPRLQFARFDEALHSITNQIASTNLPLVRGDGGPYWEDGLGANALTTALARRNMRRILSAEKVGALASLANRRVAPDQRALGDAWREILLIDEHTWHADCSVREPKSQQSVRQGAAKDARATRAQSQIDQLLERGLAALADEVRAPAGTILVFNPLNWTRDGEIELDVAVGARLQDVESGAWAPDQVLSKGNQIEHLKVLARAVPGIGYRCFRIVRDAPKRDANQRIQDGVLETAAYRVELDPVSGQILSLYDKQLGRNLARSNETSGFGQYLYVEGADTLPNRLVQYSTVTPLPDLHLRPATQSRLLSAERSPLGLTARIESSTVNSPSVLTELSLREGDKRIEILNRVQKTYTERKEAAYFCFPFALANPHFRFGTQNGVVDPEKDLLPGASLEWFCPQDWIAVDDQDVSIGLALVDAPLITLGDIARGKWPREFGHRPATVYSYVMNNYTPEGYQAGQGGTFVFRYSLTSGPHLGASALARLGAEATTPLEINEVTSNDKASPDRGYLPGTSGSFLDLGSEHVSVVTWKTAEDGRGSILRLLETRGRTGEIRARFPFWRINQAWLCTALEKDLRSLQSDPQELRITVGPYSITTVRLVLH